MKRKIFVLFFSLFIFSILYNKIQLVKGEEKEPDSLTVEDLKVQGATTEYLEAYKLYLKASVTDKGEYTYSKAISALREVFLKTPNPDIQLRCLFLITFSYFLDGKIGEAIKSGEETFNLAKKVLKENPNIILLEKLKEEISTKNISDISYIINFLNLGGESAEFIKELYILYQSHKELSDIRERCWEKYKPALYKKIEEIAEKYKLSFEIRQKIKEQLEEKYKEKGFFFSHEIEDPVGKILMETLF